MLLVITGLALQAPAPAAAEQALRAVDWKNRSYGRYLHLRDGRFAYRRYPARHHPLYRRCRHTSRTAHLGKVYYQDMTGDSAPEAIVEIYTYRNECTGVRWYRRHLIVFAWRAGGVKELGRFAPLAVRQVQVRRSAIHIERLENRRGKAVVCRDVWRFRRGTLQITKTNCPPLPAPPRGP